MSEKKTIFLFWGLLSIGLVLRLVQLGGAPFWYDEVFSLSLARLDFTHLMAATAGDFHPPLYYLLISAIYQATRATSEWVYRLPSVVFDLISAYTLCHIGYRLKLSTPAVLFALAFFCLSPFQIHYSQETRQYAMLEMWIVLLVYFTLCREYKLAGIFAALALYTHNYSLLYLPVIGILALSQEIYRPVRLGLDNPMGLTWVPGDESRLKQVILYFGLAAASFIPWGIVLINQMSSVKGGYWIEPTTPGAIVYAVYMLFWGFAQADSMQVLGVMVTTGLVLYSVIYAILTKEHRVLLWLGLAPIGLTVLISWIVEPVMLFRGLIGTTPFIYLLLGVALFRGTWRPLYTTIALLPLVISGITCYYVYNPINKGDLGLLKAVEQIAQPGDVIYHVDDSTYLPFSWYASYPEYELPECATRNKGALSLATRAALGIHPTTLTPNLSGRSLIVWSDGPLTPQCEVDAMTALVGSSQPAITIRNDEFVFTGVWIK